MDRCKGLFGALFGHRFKPVITKSAVKDAPLISGGVMAVKNILDSHRDETYHGLYCSRCGKREV